MSHISKQTPLITYLINLDSKSQGKIGSLVYANLLRYILMKDEHGKNPEDITIQDIWYAFEENEVAIRYFRKWSLSSMFNDSIIKEDKEKEEFKEWKEHQEEVMEDEPKYIRDKEDKEDYENEEDNSDDWEDFSEDEEEGPEFPGRFAL